MARMCPSRCIIIPSCKDAHVGLDETTTEEQNNDVRRNVCGYCTGSCPGGTEGGIFERKTASLQLGYTFLLLDVMFFFAEHETGPVML